MRTYPVDSPQAAARIVALTVVADGDIRDAEIALLDRLAVHQQLGLARAWVKGTTSLAEKPMAGSLGG